MTNDELRKKFFIVLENRTRETNQDESYDQLDVFLSVGAELQAERSAEVSRLTVRQHLLDALYLQGPLR
jgi:hypothetical protein